MITGKALLRQNGVCTTCAIRPSLPGKSSCQVCRKYAHKIYHQSIQEGKCMNCRKIITEEMKSGNIVLCKVCLQKKLIRERKRRVTLTEMGRCYYCKKPLTQEEKIKSRMCQACVQKKSEYGKMAYELKKLEKENDGKHES